ncbi:hypothetical protein IT084_15530 [Desulfallas sp. Bu1-1]|uniref:stalk domain-containing protein n=1 Tax=Desulfallas sp. Bu1-1 TaxID=2787620 RepID=UPI00189C9FB7|nr:stalk domain-containing protein [Desulfallas sp. Bu1-1]MBF7084364.1 hypothetical protein [Desulfallas sp. Bu1-1]
MKKRFLRSITVKLIAMFTLAALAVAVVAPMAWAGEGTIKVKYRLGKDIVIENFPNPSEYAWNLGAQMGERYPTQEVIEIDGVPWQDSPYAEVIKENLTFYGETGSYFARHPELIEIALDKRFNGKGAEVWSLFSQGKSVDEIKQILSGSSEKQPETGVSKDKPVTKELPPPEPGEISVVLYLNQKDYSVARDGTWRKASLDAAPTVDNKRTMVPLRGVMEQFGASVEWLPESKQIKVRLEDKEVVLTLGSTEALVNGQAAKLDVPAKVINGRTLIPLRFVSEQIGMNVIWEGKTQSITIKQK